MAAADAVSHGLVDTRKRLRKLKCTIVAILCHIHSVCLDVKCSNSSNHRRLVSVPVPRIRDVSLCYPFQSERITETAKQSKVVNYLDSLLSHPGLLKPNRDILESRSQRSGFRDRVSQTGTVPEKPGRLVSLGNAGWCEIANSIFSIFFFCTGKFILT